MPARRAKKPAARTTTPTATGPRLKAPPPLSDRPDRTWKEAAEPTLGYYRHPTIHADQIVFCNDDDLWTVPAEGGTARRLTASRSLVAWPRISPDGKWIAFAGADEGQLDLYLMPAGGGEPRRLTHLGGMILILGWSANGKDILVASDSRQPFMGYHHLLAVPIAGGEPKPINLGPARAYTNQPDGPGRALARNGLDPARWKRYRGGTAGTLWVDPTGKGNFRRILPKVSGNFASPMWIGKRIYFISDHEGTGNIYSCLPSGRGLKRHTNHDGFYARFPSSDGTRIVYHAGADLRLFDPATGEDRAVSVQVRSPRTQRNRKFVTAKEGFEGYDPHPQGHSLLMTLRGRPATLGFWDGPATEFGLPWRGRHRLARWLNDGKRIVALTDEDGEEKLEIITPGKGTKRIETGLDLGRILSLVVAPQPQEDEKLAKRRGTKKKARRKARPKLPDRIAVTNQRQELFVIDLTQGKANRIDKSPYDRIHGVSWSPDGRWVAYGCGVGRRHVAIKVADARTGNIHQITGGDFIDFQPCFDPEGKYLYFLSLRTYDPVYDVIQFGLGFPRGVRPYLVTLKADEPTPLLPSPRPLEGKPGGATLGNNPWEVAGKTKEWAGGSEGKKGPKRATKVSIDFDGIGTRVLAIPMPEGRYDDLQAGAGRIFVRSQPIEGSLGMSWGDMEPPSKSTIEYYDLTEMRGGTFAGKVTSFSITADLKTLVYRSGRRLRATSASGEPGKLPPGDEAGRKTGWIDLTRIRAEVRPGDEWRQMLIEAWRLQRDQFWVPDLSKVDWQGILDRYLPLVDRVATRGELSDLIWEMQGELGTSHAYELGGDYRRPPVYPIGQLGADLTFNANQGAWQVKRIPQGDSWEPGATSPLATPGTGIGKGTLIHAVNGREVDKDRSPAECLLAQAGQEVWLTVSEPAKAGKKAARRRTVSLRTLRQEYRLRYRDWVERNRAWVHRQSGGKAGYIHIPNMGPLGYSEFHRYFLAEVDYPGLVIDVRFNGGGHVSQLLFDKLLRKRVGYDISRYMAPEPYPSEAPCGPMVALTNELAGSDGDIFSHCWKLYELGPLVGVRTWGGVIGIWPRHSLVDGTITTQPEFSFWFQDVGWGVENYGTDPDIEIDIAPQDFAAGKDPQMERGLREVMQLIGKHKPPKPNLRERPSRKPPALPGR